MRKNDLNRELERIKTRYITRRLQSERFATLYSATNPSVYMAKQECERKLLYELSRRNIPVESARLLDIGCGTGSHLARFIDAGFQPQNLVGIDLMEDRVSIAKGRLPKAVTVLCGNAVTAELPGQYDIIHVSTVFSSILDEAFRKTLADRIWSLLKYGGLLIFYDFTYNNPHNRDVRSLKAIEFKSLFAKGHHKIYRVTLAPPISRHLTKFHPSLYSIANIFPFLRTHILAFTTKPYR